MSTYSSTRKSALIHWKTRSKRVYKTTDNFSGSIECEWQDLANNLGYEHVSIFCSIGQFGAHITDLLRDYRFDKYEFDQSDDINELIFRYYSRILLIASEILTDFQDVYIIADQKLSTKKVKGMSKSELRSKQDEARRELGNGTTAIINLLDYINKICKHKTSNFHICNHHIAYTFEDFHTSLLSSGKRLELGLIKQFTSYDEHTFRKHNKPDTILVPRLNYILDLVLDGYQVLDNLFKSDESKFDFICRHYEDK